MDKSIYRFFLLSVAALLLVVPFSYEAKADEELCRNDGFSTASGTVVCNGSSNPLTVTAAVETSARLILKQVFGGSANLTVPFGNIDFSCANTPVSGVTCTEDGGGTFSTWYGNLQFEVRLGGLSGSTTAKLTGIRPTAGSIPTGQLLDGASSTLPATAYPVTALPASGITLQSGLGNGTTTVTRSLGIKVNATDAAASWSGNAVYSLVIE